MMFIILTHWKDTPPNPKKKKTLESWISDFNHFNLAH